MNDSFVLEQVIDVVDNYYHQRPLTTEANIVEHVVDLLREIATLSAEKESLSEQLADLEENL